MSDKLDRVVPPAASPTSLTDTAAPPAVHATPIGSTLRATAETPVSDLASLGHAWRHERDSSVRAALAAALTDLLVQTSDGASAAAWLEAVHCTDSMRSDVARRTPDPDRRRIALAGIHDERVLAKLAVAVDVPELRTAAAQRLQALTEARSARETDRRREPSPPETDTVGERASRYVPRILQQHLHDDPSGRAWSADGTSAFVDISGFTKLSERLARKGREGAEQITDVIGRSFESILEVAYDNGGSLLKFGGDALLIWFEGTGHAERACRAAVLMRKVLRKVGRIELPGAKVTLRVSQGVHSGRFHFFAVGTSHVELLTTGPAWSRLVAMEQAATGGEIVVSAETAAAVASRCIGAPNGPGLLLAREPAGRSKVPLIARPRLPGETLARCLSPTIREHLLAGGGASEHRPVTIAFIRFEGTDAMIGQQGVAATADALHEVISVVQTAAEAQQLTFLASDIDANGGKLILTGGAPKVTGEDEERMLLALRAIASAELPLSLRTGIHRGAVFAGDIGPFYRRTYTVMGDAVNLAARLMAKSTPGSIYATADVLDHSNTLFQTVALEPFMVKGKAQPIVAWSVGPATGSRTRQVSLQRLSLIGRDIEAGAVREALVAARAGNGRLIEISGEAGVGKTRLLEEISEETSDFKLMHAVCEAYTASTPYAVWRELLREYLGFTREHSDDAVEAGIRAAVASSAPDLAPWIPLIAIAFDVSVAPTREVELLAQTNRRAKMHESVAAFLHAAMKGPHLVVIEDAHQMDGASAELLAYLAGPIAEAPWLFAVARRPSNGGFVAPDAASVKRVRLDPLAPADALRMTQLACHDHPLQPHLLETIARRSGGNPQFLRDLVRSAIASGGLGRLPDSAEAAAMARIDTLTPADRAIVRRAAVFGMTFHPRMLAWLAEEEGGVGPPAATWERLADLFEQEPDGYLRFRRSHLRDGAYEGLPYKVRRQLHGVVATRLAGESEESDEIANILALHWFEAGDYGSARRYAAMAAKRAQAMYAYVEAAEFYGRALEAARRLTDVPQDDFASMHEAQADCWYRAAEFNKASDGYAAALRLNARDPVAAAKLLLMRSLVEHKLGNYSRALRWAARSRKAVVGLDAPGAEQQAAQTTSWYAVVLQAEGRTKDALRWAERALVEAKSANDAEAIGEAYAVMGWAFGILGRDGAQDLFKLALEAYERSGNLARQAGVLTDLGVVSQWEGRWDEALAYYERGRDESQKIGNTIQAALARINIAEILIDRGEYAQAEALLMETLPLWKAAQHRYFLAVCLFLLGRSSMRAGRLEEALRRLEEAKANFETLGAEEDVPSVLAAIAEWRLCNGDVDDALDLATTTLGRAGMSNGVARVAPTLKRIRAHALRNRGDPDAARAELKASLAAARARRDLFEILRSLMSCVELDRSHGVEPDAEIVAEAEALLERLRIRQLPPAPRGFAGASTS
jgi:class 3 adenylate cyclase/tetratricopeptide (TPR) repeat protein